MREAASPSALRAPASVINEGLSDIYQTCQDGGAAFRLWK